MPAANKKQIEKQKERARLLERKKITITLEADEETMERIGALLMLAKLPFELEDAPPLGPLPWEDPTDPRYQKPPELEIDYNAIRNAIVKAMTKYLEKNNGEGRHQLRDFIHSRGGTKVTDVPEDNLQSLLNDFNRLNKEIA